MLDPSAAPTSRFLLDERRPTSFGKRLDVPIDPGDGPPAEKRKRDKPDGVLRADMIKAIDHPLRRQILRLFAERDEPLSAVQVAEGLDISLSKTAHHVRLLARLRALVLARKKQVRGAVQRFYRSAIEDDPPVETLLDETREADDEQGRKGKGGQGKGKKGK